MTRSLSAAMILICATAVTLSGCTGSSFDELDKAPVAMDQRTTQPRAALAACISDKLSRFGSDFGSFPDVEPGITRLLLGGEESGHYRNYYRIDILDQTAGSSVSVRRSKAQDDGLPASQMFDIVANCTG